MEMGRWEGGRFTRSFGQFIALEKHIDVLRDPCTSFFGESEIGLGRPHPKAFVLAWCPDFAPTESTPQRAINQCPYPGQPNQLGAMLGIT